MSKFLTRKEAAEYLTAQGLRIAVGSLQKYACIGGGPLYQRFGNKCVYMAENLDAWARAKLSAPAASTSERTEAADAAA